MTAPFALMLPLAPRWEAPLTTLPMRCGHHCQAVGEPWVTLFQVNAQGQWESGHPQVHHLLTLLLPDVPLTGEVIQAVAMAFWLAVRQGGWQGPWGRLEARFGQLRLIMAPQEA